MQEMRERVRMAERQLANQKCCTICYISYGQKKWCKTTIVLYRGKEEIHSEIELTIYKLKWYCPTNIIILALWMLNPKLVLLLTEILQNPSA